jgi:sulfonate transport system ATP-binding protein
MNMAGISIAGLTKIHRIGEQEVTALRDLCLEVEEGSFVTVVGRSGSGKTTLLRLLGGLEEKTRGEVDFIDGDGSDTDAKVSMVFQEPRLMPWLTVEKNMGFSIRNEDPAEVKEIVGRHLKLLGLQDFAQAYPHQISGGMAQRVALGRTLCYDPDIILMDEPLGALDAFTRHRLQREISRLFHHGNKTVVFVTHDVDEAVLLGQRAVILAEGSIKKQLPIELPYPRDPGDERFYKYRREILEAIFEEE